MDLSSVLKWLRDFFGGNRSLSISDLENIGSLKQRLDELLRSIFPVEPDKIATITYHSVIGYFVTKRPQDNRVARGAVLLQYHHNGGILFQVFLDKENNLLSDQRGSAYGRRIMFETMDKELEDAFGGKELIIVE